MTGDLGVLPVRTGGAAENMAVDFLMLQRWPDSSLPGPRFRHYEWRAPAFTFGYSQKWEAVQAALPTADGARRDICRRATGGGLVDHREDWTYTVVIPRGHKLEELRASESYRLIHEALAGALRAQGVPAALADAPTVEAGAPAGPFGVCFQRAERYDVVGPSGKIAGAAQKRSKLGLLFQGSVWKPAAGAKVDWERLSEDFTQILAGELGGGVKPIPFPEFREGELEALTDQYSDPEWNEQR
ncbi:MAG TPA: lipoate--protein ligase family protein [Opitutaceae bacterium]|jgi:lipoate-protein ligase A